MRSIFLTIVLLAAFTPVFGQSGKGRIQINYGFQRSYMYSPGYSGVRCFEGCIPTSQASIWLRDLNLLYVRPINAGKWSMLLGMDVNSKGWNEEGLSSPGSGPPSEPYEIDIIHKYIGLLGGVSYDLVAFKKYKLSVGQLLHPEIPAKGCCFPHRIVAVNTRTTATLQAQLGKSSAAFVLTPYFYTALMGYSEPSDHPESLRYTPYGFGLTAGLSLKVK